MLLLSHSKQGNGFRLRFFRILMQMRPGRICIAEGDSLPANPIRLFWGRCSDISGRSFKDPFWDSSRIVWIGDGLVQIGGRLQIFMGFNPMAPISVREIAFLFSHRFELHFTERFIF